MVFWLCLWASVLQRDIWQHSQHAFAIKIVHSVTYGNVRSSTNSLVKMPAPVTLCFNGLWNKCGVEGIFTARACRTQYAWFCWEENAKIMYFKHPSRFLEGHIHKSHQNVMFSLVDQNWLPLQCLQHQPWYIPKCVSFSNSILPSSFACSTRKNGKGAAWMHKRRAKYKVF